MRGRGARWSGTGAYAADFKLRGKDRQDGLFPATSSSPSMLAHRPLRFHGDSAAHTGRPDLLLFSQGCLGVFLWSAHGVNERPIAVLSKRTASTHVHARRIQPNSSAGRHSCRRHAPPASLSRSRSRSFQRVARGKRRPCAGARRSHLRPWPLARKAEAPLAPTNGVRGDRSNREKSNNRDLYQQKVGCVSTAREAAHALGQEAAMHTARAAVKLR
eukprot:357117-Chlamydomonas_euryale.AAC.6